MCRLSLCAGSMDSPSSGGGGGGGGGDGAFEWQYRRAKRTAAPEYECMEVG